MTKLQMLIELNYNAAIMHGDDPDSKEWFYKYVLGNELILHSNEIGNEIGTVKLLEIKPHNHLWTNATDYDFDNLHIEIDNAASELGLDPWDALEIWHMGIEQWSEIGLKHNH